MGKITFEVNGHYYIIDDVKGTIKRVIIQDESNIPKEDLEELVKLLAGALAKSGATAPGT